MTSLSWISLLTLVGTSALLTVVVFMGLVLRDHWRDRS